MIKIELKNYPGIIPAIIGATIATLFSLLSFTKELPAQGLYRWLVYFSLAVVALIIAVLLNWASYRTLEAYELRMQEAERGKQEVERGKQEAERSKQKAEQIYLTAQRRLGRLLARGLEDTLRRRISSLPVDLSERPDYAKNLKFYVFAQVGGYHKVVAATVSASAPVRKIELELESGIVGYAFRHKKAILANSLHERRSIYDLQCKLIGDQKELDDSTLEKCDIAVQWIYAMPIYDGKQFSTKVVGVFTVDSTEKGDVDLFQTAAFQKEIEEIAADVSPYLAVFEEIEQKSE